MQLKYENATLEEVSVAMDCTTPKRGSPGLQALSWLYGGNSREAVATHSRAQGQRLNDPQHV